MNSFRLLKCLLNCCHRSINCEKQLFSEMRSSMQRHCQIDGSNFQSSLCIHYNADFHQVSYVAHVLAEEFRHKRCIKKEAFNLLLRNDDTQKSPHQGRGEQFKKNDLQIQNDFRFQHCLKRGFRDAIISSFIQTRQWRHDIPIKFCIRLKGIKSQYVRESSNARHQKKNYF